MNPIDQSPVFLKPVPSAVPAAPAAPVLAQAVTAHQAFSMGGAELFAVQAGVPLLNALETLRILIGSAGAAVVDVAAAIEDGGAVAPWGTAHMLDAAYALTASIHAGLDKACEVGSAGREHTEV